MTLYDLKVARTDDVHDDVKSRQHRIQYYLCLFVSSVGVWSSVVIFSRDRTSAISAAVILLVIALRLSNRNTTRDDRWARYARGQVLTYALVMLAIMLEWLSIGDRWRPPPRALHLVLYTGIMIGVYVVLRVMSRRRT